jgi:hypothetical protein
MDQELLDALVADAVKITQKRSFILEDFLFQEQIALARDPARFATAVCSVRAGKTITCAADLIDTAITMPGTTSLYITLARSSAKRIVWPELHAINRTFKLGGESNESELSFRFPNRSIIYCFGASDATQIEKIRGLSNVALAYIDESQAFRTHIKELVEEILIKRLYDTNGRLRLIGTPGPMMSGYFYEASQSTKWSHHAWTLHSNPWIHKKSGKTVAELIEQDCERQGVTLDHPSIQRECFGRWIQDKEALILQYNPEVNDYEMVPPGAYSYLLGIDLGSVDANSLSVLAWSEAAPTTWLVEESQTTGQLIDELAADIKVLMKRYPFSKMVADAGGLGKMVVEDLRARHGLPIEAADKAGKMSNYAFLGNALRRGDFKAKRGSAFAQDCNILEKDRDKSTPEKIVVKGHSDAVDSALYAFKFSPAYSYQAPVPKPKHGTPEYDKNFADRMFQSNLERLQREKEMKENPNSTHWNTDPQGVPSWLKWED